MTKPALIAVTIVVVCVLRSPAQASTVPSAPASPVATPGISGASVSFTPSASDGGSPILHYTVTSSPGGITATGAAPPIAVNGLANGVAYTFTATATNNNGTSAASAASNTVVPSAALAPWYNTLWTGRQTIAVAGSAAGAQTNYPVKITLGYAAGMKADFSDLRFTDSSGTLLLSYWVETETDNSAAVVWVKVPSVPLAPDSATIYAYYGNPAAVSQSNGDTTFTFFDTFGSGGTPGDWNYTNNMIGEHAIIHSGKLYAPLYDSDYGVNGGLVVLNPVTGSVIKHFTIPGYCTAAAPAFDKNGYLHVYDCGGFLAKLDENTGTILRTLNIGGAVDWEAVAYDPVNDVILIASKDDHSLSAVRSSDYSLAWRNTDVNLTYGSSEIDPPLIVGAYVYWQDYSGTLFKISLSTGITAASTNATAAGLPATPYAFSSYSQIIYDSVNNRLYLTNSNGHTAFAVNPADLSVAWSKVVESAGWNFNRGGAWHNNVWYVTARQTAFPYRSRIYALDTQNGGNILWTNTTAYDNGAEVSSILADYNYVYAGTYDYSDQDYNKLLMLNVLDGSVAATIPLLNGVASSIPTFYGGKIVMGLWYDVSGQQVGGYQALQVRDGGGTGDFYYKADLYQTGYVGAFASGPLTARIACGYPSLDPTKWIVNGLSSITDCMAASTVNVSVWADYLKSTLTFSRSNTAIRVRAKNSEPSSNSWDTWLGFTNNIGVCHPVCAGRNNGQMLFTYDQNGSPQTTFGPAYNFDQYNTSEVKMAYPGIQFDVNDSNVGGSANWSTSYDQVPIQLGNFKGIATVDWVLVRNYANPEPVPSIGEEIGVTVPSAPLSPVATPGNGQAVVSFIPPVSNGGSLITGYTVTSHPGNGLAGGSASPIVVPGLTNGMSYTFTVTATNATGDSSPSAASNSVTPAVPLSPALTVAKAHTGNFTQGQNGATYSVVVSNAAGAGPTSGTVTVTETAPAGMTLASMSGTGWTCPGTAANNCTRSDALDAGASYPAISVAVNVAAGASSPQVNQVSVSGGGSGTATATDSTTIVTAFSDTSPTDFFFDAVNLMREYGITAGCGASTYCPNDNATRAQMAIFVVRSVLGGDNFTYSATPYFNDVPSGAFGFQWIQKMWELGITAGCGVGMYCPNDPVTRGQMAIFVIRARLGAAADSTFTYPAAAYFTDVPASYPYFKWIQRMKLDQITAGCGVGTYCPNDPVTRGQMAIFIMRGGFDLLLPVGTPVLAGSTPATAPIGQATTVTLTGTSTNFVQGTTVVSAGPGITVGTATVTSATTLSVTLTVAGNAAAGPRTLVATTGSEQAVLPNGLAVQ